MISTTMTTKVTARGVALTRSAPKARRTAVARAGASDRELWYPGAQAPAYLDGSMAGDYGKCARLFVCVVVARVRVVARLARGITDRNARARGKIRYAPVAGDVVDMVARRRGDRERATGDAWRRDVNRV